MDGETLAEAMEAGRSRRADLLEAMDVLEAELARPASANGPSPSLDRALRTLRQAFDAQRESVEDPNGLFADLADSEPRLRSHVIDLRNEHTMIAGRAEAIEAAIRVEDHDADIVSRISDLLSDIASHGRHIASLAYDAVDIDIPAID
jgi:hypothetical protein